MYKNGFGFIVVIVIVAIVAAIIGYLMVREQQIFHINVPPVFESQMQSPAIAQNGQPAHSSFPEEFGSFESALIYKKVPFINSEGIRKNFIILDTGRKAVGEIPIVNSYITDDKLSKRIATEISVISGPTSALGYAVTDPNSVSISVSPGRTRKFIVISSFGGGEDGGFITLIDENGRVISEEVSDNILPLVKGKCQCAFEFWGWTEADKFYVIAHTAMGFYRVVIDASTGKAITALEKIDKNARGIY